MNRIGLSILLIAAVLTACLIAPAPGHAAAQKNIILATTTSTQDSGLLDVLIPMFEKKTGYFVKTIAVGSGQAMAMGRKGEADVLLVHSPEAEEAFMKDGFGTGRRLVMHNDFIIVGPAADRAGIAGTKSAAAAFKKIAASQALFMSRGDQLRHRREGKVPVESSRYQPVGQKWYQETGLGMGQTLNVASEKQAYTLADRGTYAGAEKTARPRGPRTGRQGPSQRLSRDRGQP